MIYLSFVLDLKKYRPIKGVYYMGLTCSIIFYAICMVYYGMVYYGMV